MEAIDSRRLIFAISATTLGIFLSLFFFFRPHANRTADLLLGGVFACIALSQASFLATPQLFLSTLPHLSRLGYPALTLMPALLFFYVRSITEPEYRFGARDLVHGLGFFTLLAAFSPYYFRSARFKIEHPSMENLGPYFESLNTYVWYAILAYVLGYLIAIFVLVSRHQKRIKETFSNIRRIRLSWLRYFVVVSGACWLVVILITLFDVFGLSRELYKDIVPGLITLFLFFIGFRAISQPEIYQQRGGSDSALKKGEPLDEGKIRRYEDLLYQSMGELRLSADPDLSLPALAERLSIPRNDLSYIINKKTGGNFFDFINSYRVEEVKRLLLRSDKDNLTLLAIALEAGFNSKATFNAVFKALAKCTPSQFKKAARREKAGSPQAVSTEKADRKRP